ncbi:MAG: uracil phosphoribosyltransferase [Caulobacter sp.]|nr:uracil phosphoribosyltransferase [Caulobacter sp.]
MDPRSLLNAEAVRAASVRALDTALAGGLAEWTVDLSQLEPTADFVAEVIRDQYPTLEVPFHARWRHFTVGGQNLWTATARWPDADAKARTAFDLAITSVMLDAGAGPDWKYRDAASGTVTTRSEGLGVASLRTFESGAFATDPKGDPLRADDLSNLTVEDLSASFQVSEANPLVGLEGRAALLQRLGHQVAARPDLFATRDVARPGGLYDILAGWAGPEKVLPARRILDLLLEALGPIWQNRLEIDGVPMGDTWAHPVLGLVPIHKLSQWLSYSLIEPLQDAGVTVVEIDGLTGLAEYRNGGLFIDKGVTVLRDPADLARVHNVSDPLVVGWRTLTVALLDKIAPLVRERLGVAEADFPLARVLEGGTWAAGRVAAKQLREGGPPPLMILSDGTVF